MNTNKAVLAQCQESAHLLPKRLVDDYIFVATTLNALSTAGEKFKTSPGTAPGFLEVSSLLSEVAKVKGMNNPLVAARGTAIEDANIVTKAWKKMLSNMLQRCEATGELSNFLEQTDKAANAISDWAEEDFPDWLKAGEGDMINSASAKVEQCVGQLPTWRKQLERVSQMMDWASKEDQDQVKHTLEKFGAWETLVAGSSLRLATLSVAAAYLTLPPLESESSASERRSQMELTLKHMTSKLMIKTEALPMTLRERVQNISAQSIAEKSEPSSAAADGAAADGSKVGRRLAQKRGSRF